MKNKIIVILGPTASGKTDLSVKLAKKFSGEIISADSRQVYKGMDIGTGKVTKKEMQEIPHHLINVASPKKRFNIAKYQKLAKIAIEKIQKKNKIPFLVGGTGFYIDSVINNINLPEINPDWKLRKELEKKSLSELFKRLVKLDPKRAKNIDKKNPRRIIRALEIIIKSKNIVPPIKKDSNSYNPLIIGIKKEDKELKKLIKKRLLKRLKKGMIAEVKNLKSKGVSFKRMEEFGLEYRFISLFLQKKIKREEMIEKLQKEIEHYAKRQMTWFKRNKRINWIKNYKEAEKKIKDFI